MKIKVTRLKPNPFRSFGDYPIDRQKVEELKQSIQSTDFWDNLLAREVDGAYELAYGHHRLIALQELGIDEIDISVKNLDDSAMLRIMANENFEFSKSNDAIRVETVKATKQYLDKIITEAKTLDDLRCLPNLGDISDGNNNTLSNLKAKKAGVPTIQAFLGEPWKKWMVEKALSIINNDLIDNEIAGEVGLWIATNVSSSVNQINEKRKKENKPELTPDEVKKAVKKVKQSHGKNKVSPKKWRDDIKNELSDEDVDSDLQKLAADIDDLNTKARTLKKKIIEVNTSIEESGINAIQNNALTLDAIASFGQLFNSADHLFKYFGLNLTEQIKQIES